LSNYSVKSDPVYLLDKNGINFIRRCTQLLEEEKLNEEGIYRKNGVSHKINQFIERNFTNISSSLVQPNDTNNTSNEPVLTTASQTPTSLMVSVLKNTLPHSSSSSTLSLSAQSAHNLPDMNHLHQNSSSPEPASNNMNSTSSTSISRNYSASNLPNNISMNSFGSELGEDTCTITSALKHYLIRLKEPLMTFSYNQQFLNACSKFLKCTRSLFGQSLINLALLLDPFNFFPETMEFNSHIKTQFFILIFVNLKESKTTPIASPRSTDSSTLCRHSTTKPSRHS